MRGAVVDIFSMHEEGPVRVEWMGSRIESVRSFDPTTQRSTTSTRAVRLLPAGETLSASVAPRESFLGYLPREAIVVMEDAAGVVGRGTEFESQLNESSADDRNPAFSEIMPLSSFLEAARKFQVLTLDSVTRRLPGSEPELVHLFDTRSLETIPGRFEGLVEMLSGWRQQRWHTVLACNNEGEMDRLRELLSERGFPPGEDLEVVVECVERGFSFPDAGLSVVSDQDVFGRYRMRRRHRKRTWHGVPVSSAQELERRAPVVHVRYGIGRYLGIEKLDSDGVMRDFITIEYLGGDKLYVPVEQVHLVHQYVGPGESPPRFDRLGSGTWEKVKGRARRAIRDMASELVSMAAVRQTAAGFACSPDTRWQREFEAAFIYEETRDQFQAICDIKRDMESPRPMDRLVCGDVGYGKTEVAIRAAFKAVMDSRQVAVLVPTTLLAEQHCTTFSDRLADYPVKVEVLSRFKSPREQKRTLEGLREGKVDIVIGTHRLVQKDVKFKELGLVIVDEEQRFGVAHKERLKQLRKTVDVLTLTATPIPRTLHMALVGLREMSSIMTPPEDRLPVETRVAEWDPDLVGDAVRREMNRGGQVFFVHNRVETIDRMAHRLQQIVPEARIGVGHGQMPERDLKEVMHAFVNRDLDVLVSTNIVESGLDIPSANTLIVDRSDTFGLADLYQLRGRIGRFKHKAYACFMIDRGVSLSQVARRRLKAMEDFSDLGSGFRIALQDLEIRGAGNLLGGEQHGFMAALGFDLYRQLLERTVRELKGEKAEEWIAPTLDLGWEAYLPDSYVGESALKFDLYRKMGDARCMEDVEALRRELEDRFGPPGPEVSRLVSMTELRVRAGMVGLSHVGLQDDHLLVRLSARLPLSPEMVESCSVDFGDGVEVKGDDMLLLPLGDAAGDEQELEQAVRNLLRVVGRCANIKR